MINKDQLIFERDDDEIKLDQEVERIAQVLTNEMLIPDEAIDKQIIAAAQRDIVKPRTKNTYAISRWRRWSLPIYVTAGFSFCVLAINALWQPPQYSSEHLVSSSNEVDKGEERIEITLSEEPKSTRIKRELPTFVTPENPPKVVTKTPESQASGSDIDDGDASSLYTGSQSTKVAYPEKNAWVRKIISHMKSGELEVAKTEMVRFKKVYPDYPLEEQIKVLNN